MRLSQLPPNSAHLLQASKGPSQSTAEIRKGSAYDTAAQHTHLHDGIERGRASSPVSAAHNTRAADVDDSSGLAAKYFGDDAHAPSGPPSQAQWQSSPSSAAAAVPQPLSGLFATTPDPQARSV